MQRTNETTAITDAGNSQYRIIGDDLQMLEIRLAPEEEVIGEAGAMMYMEPGIEFDTKMGKRPGAGGGLIGGLMNAGARMLAGESILVTHFKNESNQSQIVAFSSEAPGKIVPIDLGALGGTVLAQRDAFLCGAPDTGVTVAFQRNLGAGLFGGEGFILQKVQGNGHIFMSAGGTIIERDLQGEKLRIDSGCIVAFQEGINYDIQRAGNLRSMLGGGEGLFLATLQGHGKVWLQSMPIGRLAHHIYSKMPSSQ
jgi:uncharacterized protein (TIGR00266 family)